MFVPVVVVLAVVPAVVGVLLGRHGHGQPGRRHHQDVPTWREVLGLTFSAVGLAVVVLGVVRLRRSGAWAAAWNTPLRALTVRQRRGLLRQVRGLEPVDPEPLPLARHLAQRLQDNYRGPLRQQLLTMAGTGLLLAGNAVRRADRFLAICLVLYVALLPVAVVLTRRDAGRADAFLFRHPEPKHGPP